MVGEVTFLDQEGKVCTDRYVVGEVTCLDQMGYLIHINYTKVRKFIMYVANLFLQTVLNIVL